MCFLYHFRAYNTILHKCTCLWFELKFKHKKEGKKSYASMGSMRIGQS